MPAAFGDWGRTGGAHPTRERENHRKVSLPPATPPDDPDALLAVRLRAGDEQALALLMARHGGRLRQLARRMTGRADEAEDIVQEAFVAIWRHAYRLEAGKASIGAYLTRTVINRCIDRARRERIRRWIGLDTVPEIEDEAPAADDMLQARSEMQAVARDLTALPPRQRAAILLVSSGDRSIADVAEAMSLSVGAVEQLLVRARRVLRARALERLGTEGSEGR